MEGTLTLDPPAPFIGDDGNLTLQLVRRTSLAGEMLGSEAREMAKACLLDWTGVTIAGAQAGEINILVGEAVADGGGPHPLIGRSERVSCRDSVLINGAASHMLDYDDGLPAMMGHASVAILPALLGIAMRAPVGGEKLLRALAIGVEMAGCVGRLVAPSHYDRGFHATATVGAIAAARGWAWLMGLDERATSAAIGLAAARAAGLKSSFGSPAKPLQVGWSALVGFTAATWAKGGMTAPADAIGDRQGFVAAHSERADVEAALGPASGGAHLLDTRFKRYASCGVTHALLDSLSELRASAEDLDALEVRIGRGADRICNIAAPDTGLEAKFSLRAVAAMHLLGADLSDPAVFEQDAFERLGAQRLYGHIRVDLVDDWPATRTLVTLRSRHDERRHLQDGAVQPSDSGQATAFVSRKFRSLVEPRLGEARAAALLECILGFENAPDAASFVPFTATHG